ncbi:MAG: SH3 domain-containing protein [Deltaproteobacteria bacterium]|nr:MAG: SH3 domain-containing protein [Deltaproteobacteria bacterium]
MLFLLFMPERPEAQAIFEHGKQTGAIKDMRPAPNLKSIRTPSPARKTVSPTARSEASADSAAPISPTLAVKQVETYLYERQDEYSAVVAKLEQDEKLTLLGKAFGNGKAWYMVKTQAGAIGWTISSSLTELPENNQQRKTQSSH